MKNDRVLAQIKWILKYMNSMFEVKNNCDSNTCMVEKTDRVHHVHTFASILCLDLVDPILKLYVLEVE